MTAKDRSLRISNADILLQALNDLLQSPQALKIGNQLKTTVANLPAFNLTSTTERPVPRRPIGAKNVRNTRRRTQEIHKRRETGVSLPSYKKLREEPEHVDEEAGGSAPTHKPKTGRVILVGSLVLVGILLLLWYLLSFTPPKPMD
jgi:hypothetical protein